ncbi:MAG: methyltransferase domain-containing protein [Elusimicrobia bacterium]|nr:methyltransferase domain-containing protein [Elusimicrobiota bacterium]
MNPTAMSDAGLAEIYDAAFFAEWGPSHEPYVRTAEVIADVLAAEFRPKRVADIGCGCGVYAHAFARSGSEVFALDGVGPPPEHSFPVPIHVQDLTVPFENAWGRFDLTLCLEVAEHIPEPRSEAFLDNILRFSDTLLLSAAPKGQGGRHHVNERPKRYWVGRLADHGFAYDRRSTGRVFDAVLARRPPYLWMVQHLSVYKRASDPAALRRTLPFSVRLRPESA